MKVIFHHARGRGKFEKGRDEERNRGGKNFSPSCMHARACKKTRKRSGGERRG